VLNLFTSCPKQKRWPVLFWLKKTYQKHPSIPFKTARTFVKPVGVANALWAAARMTFLGPQCAANLCIAAAEAVLEVPGKLTEFQPMELSMMLCLGFDGWLKGWRCFLTPEVCFAMKNKRHRG